MNSVIVSGGFDDLRSREVRFLQEAASLGLVEVMLWSDDVIRAQTGTSPKFPLEERQYFVGALRYVQQVTRIDQLEDPNHLPQSAHPLAGTWVVPSEADHPAKRAFCQAHGIAYHTLAEEDLQGFPQPPFNPAQHPSPQKKVLVTGCFDWLHSGHVRFFEECAQLGKLVVVVGNDANVRLLKGEGHPLLHQTERQYRVAAIRFVNKALISTGTGWMDAEPEIERIRPACYVVNEDGDQPEKRAFCEAHGLEYVVLKRLPKPGLPRRASTNLRGF